jgi:isopentenyl diphosphate isomerase/L-lactate dehydrogenase-like FMN-dependent dehydrogenase
MLTAFTDELRVSMFCCGAGDLGQLKQAAIISDSLPR